MKDIKTQTHLEGDSAGLHPFEVDLFTYPSNVIPADCDSTAAALKEDNLISYPNHYST